MMMMTAFIFVPVSIKESKRNRSDMTGEGAMSSFFYTSSSQIKSYQQPRQAIRKDGGQIWRIAWSCYQQQQLKNWTQLWTASKVKPPSYPTIKICSTYGSLKWNWQRWTMTHNNTKLLRGFKSQVEKIRVLHSTSKFGQEQDKEKKLGRREMLITDWDWD